MANWQMVECARPVITWQRSIRWIRSLRDKSLVLISDMASALDNYPVLSMDNRTMENPGPWNTIQPMKTFRDALLDHLAHTGLSVADLSKRSGVSAQQLYKIKQGKSASTNVEDAQRISDAFGKTLDEFMGSPAGEYPHEIAYLYSQLPADLRRKLVGYGEGLLAAQDQPPEELPSND